MACIRCAGSTRTLAPMLRDARLWPPWAAGAADEAMAAARGIEAHDGRNGIWPQGW